MSPSAGARSYSQYCPVAKALDVLGERWTLLVVRDLMLGPKRYTDLREGLPGIATDLLTARLRALEAAGFVARRELPRPAPATVYELTDSGQGLALLILVIGHAGLRLLGAPAEDEDVRAERVVLSLRVSFRPGEAAGTSDTYGLEIDGEPFTITVADGSLDIAKASAEDPAMRLTTDGRTLVGLLMGQVSGADALASGAATLEGRRGALERFLKVFGYPS
ncbi:MAG TPA: winged helix-turn-helix transcriptional regulator [Thermoleophilaceae bacterium]